MTFTLLNFVRLEGLAMQVILAVILFAHVSKMYN